VNGFLQRLKERKLVQWALAYIAAAFALIQVTDVVAQQFGWPDAVRRGTTIALAIGFFVTLVLAWYHGERGAQRVSGPELLILALLLAIGGVVLPRFANTSRDATTPKASGNGTTPAAAAASPIPAKSIAVLPFQNLSDDKSNAYFASGVQDEILTRLAKIGSLKVISRTSTQHYASSPDNLPQIAQQLGVANILEGSVQKVGDAVHVNVQLIRAASDEHLWAESYDRRLDDVFSVEGEIAQTVAEALNARLTAAEQQAIREKATDVPAAYEAYARGRALVTQQYNAPGMHDALAAYRKAVQIDPRYAVAWAQIAIVASFMYFNGVELDQVPAEAILHAADRAMSLRPDLGEAWLAQGYYRYRVLRDFPGALQAFRTAQERLPNDTQVLVALWAVQRRLGQWDDAVANMHKATELDPRSVEIAVNASIELLAFLRRFDEGRRILDRTLEFAPDNESVIGARAALEQFSGHLDAAAAWAVRLRGGYTRFDVRFFAAVTQALYERDFARAIALAQPLLPATGKLPEDSIRPALMLAQAQQRAGYDADARATYVRVVGDVEASPSPAYDSNQAQVAALAKAALGDKAGALDAARRAVELYRNDAIQSASAEIVLAQVQAQTGDREAAIDALAHLLEIPAGLMPGALKYDPIWDPIRNDARVKALLAEPSTGSGDAKHD
jgi:TolB-like protein